MYALMISLTNNHNHDQYLLNLAEILGKRRLITPLMIQGSNHIISLYLGS